MGRFRIAYRASIVMKPSFGRKEFISLANGGLHGHKPWDGTNCHVDGFFRGASSSDAMAFRNLHDGIGEECVLSHGVLHVSVSTTRPLDDIPRTLLQQAARWMPKDPATGLDMTGRPVEVTMKDRKIVADIQSGRKRACVPIIYATRSRSTFSPLVDVRRLAEDTRGMFIVMEEKEDGVGTACRQAGLEWIPPYNGAVDIYWPEGGWSRIITNGWDPIASDGLVRRQIIQMSTSHRHPVMPIGQPRVLAQGLAESVGVEWTGAEKLPETLSTLRKSFEDALEDTLASTRAEYEEYTQGLEERIDALSAELAASKDEADRLRRTLSSRGHGGSITLECGEEEFYPGELRDVVVSSLDRLLKSSSDPNVRERRSWHVASRIIEENPVSSERDGIVRQVEGTLGEAGRSTRAAASTMVRLGFTEADGGRGGHRKFLYHGDPRYTFTLASSPSDVRTTDNMAKEVVRRLFQ